MRRPLHDQARYGGEERPRRLRTCHVRLSSGEGRAGDRRVRRRLHLLDRRTFFLLRRVQEVVGCRAQGHALSCRAGPRRGLRGGTGGHPPSGTGARRLGIDNSPLVVRVSRRRGLKQVRVLSISEIDGGLGTFDTILMMCNNWPGRRPGGREEAPPEVPPDHKRPRSHRT